MAAVELIQSIDKSPGNATDWWDIYDRATEEVGKGGSMRKGMVGIVGRRPS